MTEYIVTKKEHTANGGAFLNFDVPVAKFYDANELNKFMAAVDDGTYWVEEVNNNSDYYDEDELD